MKMLIRAAVSGGGGERIPSLHRSSENFLLPFVMEGA